MAKLKLILGIFTIVLFIASCTTQNKTETADSIKVDSSQIIKDTVVKIDDYKIPELEQRMIDQGLVNLQTIDSTIMVELKYSTTDNFVHTDVYGDLTRAYMQQKPAEMLAKASKILQSTLIIDCWFMIAPARWLFNGNSGHYLIQFHQLKGLILWLIQKRVQFIILVQRLI